MKRLERFASALFPIILLGTLAAATFWLAKATQLPEPDRSGKFRHDPDYFVDNLTMSRLDKQGTLRSTVTGKHLVHYPDDDSAEVTTPHITLYRPSGAPLTLLGQMAHVSAKGEKVFFPGQVDIDRAASPDNQALTARTTDLTVLPEEGLASTDQHVFMTLGASELQGIGARIDNKAQTFELLANVTGRYVAQKAAP